MRKYFLLGIFLLPALTVRCSASTPVPSAAPEPIPTATPVPTAVPSATLPVFDWPDVPEMNRRIGRGVNFGDALEAPKEGEWGIVLREEYFRLAQHGGFTAIRLPVRWNAHALEEPPYTIDPVFFDRVDWAVENALSRDMILILDFHHFLPYMDCSSCERARFLMLWSQIAEHYQSYPPDLLFELLNEPTDAVPAAEWNTALAAALGVIRDTNPQRTVIVGPVGWNGLGALPTLDLPEDDRKLIVTFHYYNPFPFTHQGAEWVEGSDAWLGTTWTGSAAEQQAIRSDFDPVAAWAAAHERPIFLGEFGAYRKADIASRARWAAFVARQAEGRSFSWAYWEFCSGFGVYDPESNLWRYALLSALLPGSPELP